VEHAHHVLTNELAAEALPSQRSGANAAWFRLNVMLYDLLSAFKRVALPEELHAARPKRLRFLGFQTGLGATTVSRGCCSTASARWSATPARPCCAWPGTRAAADAARLAQATGPPPLTAA
jgi:hypothetical protein